LESRTTLPAKGGVHRKAVESLATFEAINLVSKLWLPNSPPRAAFIIKQSQYSGGLTFVDATLGFDALMIYCSVDYPENPD
jgi:hypothetical protein